MAERFAVGETKLPKVAFVPPTLKKRIERNVELQGQKETAAKTLKTARAKLRKALKDRTIQYYKQYENDERELIEKRREARKENVFYREDDPKVVFVIRTKGINKLAPKPKKILQLFRLRQLHNGVFIRLNKATQNMLKQIEPFVTYGYPSLGTIKKLVYKRGYVRAGKLGARQRIRIQTNDEISRTMGKYGIHGIEDVIYQLHTCGPQFREVSSNLWPFKLSSPKKGFVAKRHGFCEPRKGDWGNREHLVNELVNRMN